MGLFPHIAYASGGIDQFVANLGKYIINPLILLLFALALGFFLYGMFEFLTHQSEEKQTEGKSHMLWGVIGITIMVGVYFLMNLILNTFDIGKIDPREGTVELNDYNPNWPK